MKKHYPGLVTRKIAVECQPFMDTSNAKIRIKTGPTESASEWGEENRDLSSSTDISNSDLQTIISSTP